MKVNLIFVLLILLFIGCRPGVNKTESLETSLDYYFSSIFHPDEPGASIIILKEDKILFKKSYGLADTKTKEPITSSTLFNLGSISKTFVAYGILMLRDEGKLLLNDPVGKYFPHFKNQEIASTVTLQHLLTHTSGLPDIRRIAEDSVFYLTARDRENWEPILKADSLLYEPGSQFEYSNPAFNALALIIEQVSGEKWQDFIAERIFKPSNMITSTITDGPHPEQGVSHAYSFVDNQWEEDDYGEEPTFAAAGNGGVWSSIDELVNYEHAIRQALFCSESTIIESRTVDYPENWKATYEPFIAKCWFVESRSNELKTIGHTGTQGGFYSDYQWIPKDKILYIVLANREYPREVSFDKVMEILMKNNQ